MIEFITNRMHHILKIPIECIIWGGCRKFGQFSSLSASAKLSRITSVEKMLGLAEKSSNQECLWTKTSD